MANVVGGVLILLAIVVFVVCLAGLVKPSWLTLSKSKGGTPPSRLFIALGLVLLPLMLFFTGGALLDPPQVEATSPVQAAPQTADAPAITTQPATELEPKQPATPESEPEQATLGFTLKEFQKRLNTQFKSVDLPWNANSMEVKKGPVNDVYKLVAGTGYMVAVVNKAGFVTDVHTGLAGGSGAEAEAEAADGLILLGLVAGAATDGATRSEIGKAFSGLLEKTMANIDKPNAAVQKINVGNRTYSATANRQLGFTLSISPQEP